MTDRVMRWHWRRTMVTAGVLLALSGLVQQVDASPACRSAADSSAVAFPHIVVVTQNVSRDVNPRAPAWIYIREVLQRAGVFFDEVAPAKLPSMVADAKTIVLLAGDLPLKPNECKAVTQLVQKGGFVIGVGGTSGLDQVFGVKEKHPLAEGWIRITAPEHPVTRALRSSLHVFGGYAFATDSATALAEIDSGKQGAKGSVISENRFGQGRAILLGPDLLFSIVHIQQGVPVLQDGTPAPDDSAELNDGELKAEDGMVLDWQRDRTPMQPDGVPAFLEPISDELREIILRSLFYAATEQGCTMPVLWYWPRGLKAVGHISHDTDGHDPQKAVALLKVMNHCKVKSTWCTLYPGGYPREFYDTLKKQGFEIALHYDARTGGPKTSWSKENFVLQHDWLLKEAGLTEITSNKNHFTRWENRLDFLRWCEQVGIKSDQTRGPSKRGVIGFPLGGSQPYFALDDEAQTPRFINVLQVNLLTQDLVVVCPPEYGQQLVDSVLRHHGVAHFLFHPAHIEKPHVADALCNLVEYGRTHEMEWWTSRQIYQWETQRRNVTMSESTGSRLTFRSHDGDGIRDATLLLLRPHAEPHRINVNGQPVQSEAWSVYGFPFDAVTIDRLEAADITVK